MGVPSRTQEILRIMLVILCCVGVPGVDWSLEVDTAKNSFSCPCSTGLPGLGFRA